MQGKPAEIINTGVSGLRAVNHLATLKVIARFDPDLVVFLLGGNDWNRHIRERFEPDLDMWRPTPLRLSMFGSAIDAMVLSPIRRKISGKTWSDQAKSIDSADSLTKVEFLSRNRTVTHTFRPTAVLPAYAETVRDISAGCKAAQVRCLFMTQPHAYGAGTPAELIANFWMTPPWATYSLDLESMSHIASLYNEFLRSFAARAGHPVCDLASRVMPPRTLFYDDMHYTDEGSRRVAEQVLPCVLAALGEPPPPRLSK